MTLEMSDSSDVVAEHVICAICDKGAIGAAFDDIVRYCDNAAGVEGFSIMTLHSVMEDLLMLEDVTYAHGRYYTQLTCLE
jgi:hypothetical protein